MKTFREAGLDFLSNFHINSFKWKGVVWNSSEAAYQACKDGKDEWKKWSNLTPQQAKYKGQRVELREGWDDIKLAFMLDILKAKFSNIYLQGLLEETGDQELVEWNWWGDTYWGKSIQTGEGKNYLGHLLMRVRNGINEKKLLSDPR